MESHKQFKPAGFAFISVGVAFLAVAIFADQRVFYGIAPAFIGIGAMFLARASSRR